MSNFEFLKFETVQNEKYIGIATVRIYGKIILRYKIVANKNGSGFFPATASFKISKDGQDKYVPAFMIESAYEKEEIEDLIRNNVNQALNPAPNVNRPMAPSYQAPPSNSADDYQPNEGLPF